MKLGLPNRAPVGRWLLASLVVLSPLGFLLYESLADPEIRFLPPHPKAAWVLHPTQEVLSAYEHPHTARVLFVNEFELEPGREADLRLSIFGEAEVVLDGRLVQLPGPSNWKRPRRLPLAAGGGLHRLEIRVHHPESFPAIQVRSPPELITPGDWRAALGPAFEELRPVVTAGPARAPATVEAILGPRRPALSGSWATAMKALWLAAVAGIFLLGLLRLARHRTGEAPLPPAGPRTRLSSVLGGSILLLGLGVYLAVALGYPALSNVFDNAAHRDYVEHLAREGTLPEPSDGFQMYQPPLYYLLGALLLDDSEPDGEGRWRWVRLLGPLAGLALAVLSWLLVRLLVPERPGSWWIAPLFAVFVPAGLYSSPGISNEAFAAATTGAAFGAFVIFHATGRLGPVPMLLAGTVAALGLLSKFTAAFAIAASVLVLAGRAVQRRSRRAVLSLLAFLAAVLALAGWFYLRNLIRYGDPFVGNWDLASGLHYLQEPAYRTASFYLQPAAAFFTNPEWAPWTSFSGGLYASFWADVFRVLGDGSAQRRYWIEVSLLAAALPTAAIGLGLLDTCRRAWRHLFATPDIALAAAAIWSVLGLAFFTLEVPFASTVKAFYLLWLVPLAAVFLVRGRGWIAEASPALGVLHDGVLVLFSVLSFFLYVI